MSHQYQKSFSLPENFHQLLKDFTREVLRDQPNNIYEYGFTYFSRIARLHESNQENLKPHYYEQEQINVTNSLSNVQLNNNINSDKTIADTNVNQRPISASEDTRKEETTEENNGEENDNGEELRNGEEEAEVAEQSYDIAELSDHLKEALMQLDANENGFLSVEVVRRVFSQFNFLPNQKAQFLFTECAQITEEGSIEYIEFVENAMQIVQDMAQSPDKYEFLDQNFGAGEEDLVHDLNAEELEEELRTVISRSDEEGTGMVLVKDFIRELQEAELDLSRREIIMILLETPIDENLMINYEDILPNTHRIMYIAQKFDSYLDE
jgi:Ca2+-binding EF-hand superfamily protein